MLAYNVRVGDVVTFKHIDHGELGAMRVDDRIGNTVRLVFAMTDDILIRIMDYRQSGITFGLTGKPMAPLKSAAA